MSDEEISSKSITMDKFREWIQALLYYLPNARYIKTDEYSRWEYEDIMKIISRRQIQRERMDSEHQTKQKKYRYVKD
jgi:hypothetical protein